MDSKGVKNMRSLIDITDFSTDELYELMNTACDIDMYPEKYSECCKGKKLATLFFEPSTRTRLSFEAAMYELGGNVLSVADADSSSASKGETIADTARIVSIYADVMAIRHPKEGAPFVASKYATVPVINAGDGGHHHPTQTLADLLTIYREKGGLSNLTVGFCGDLKYGRTVHSLISALSRYENITVVLISPEELKIPDYIKKDVIAKNNMKCIETTSLIDAIPELDVLYMTRVQRERFEDASEYERLKDSYILSVDMLKDAKSDMSILHPMPRVNEINVNVDSDPRACYFTQAKNGKLMRMALILKLLAEKDCKEPKQLEETLVNKLSCNNPKCISNAEESLDSVFKAVDENSGIYRCIYCDHKANIKEK